MADQPHSPVGPEEEEERRRRRRFFFIWWFLAGAGALLLVIVIAVFILSSGDDDEPLVTAPSPTSTATPTAALATDTPTPTPTSTPSPSPTSTPTPTPEPTEEPAPASTPSPTATAAPSATPTATPTATSTATPTPTATPTATPAPPTMAGAWRMTVDPQPIGICSSASDTAAYLENITFTIVGSQIQVVGVDGSQMDPWTGLLDGNDITFSGSKLDGVGITTATFMLTYDPAMERLDGSENWDWVSGGGSCIGGTSIVTSIR